MKRDAEREPQAMLFVRPATPRPGGTADQGSNARALTLHFEISVYADNIIIIAFAEIVKSFSRFHTVRPDFSEKEKNPVFSRINQFFRLTNRKKRIIIEVKKDSNQNLKGELT